MLSLIRYFIPISYGGVSMSRHNCDSTAQASTDLYCQVLTQMLAEVIELLEHSRDYANLDLQFYQRDENKSEIVSLIGTITAMTVSTASWIISTIKHLEEGGPAATFMSCQSISYKETSDAIPKPMMSLFEKSRRLHYRAERLNNLVYNLHDFDEGDKKLGLSESCLVNSTIDSQYSPLLTGGNEGTQRIYCLYQKIIDKFNSY